jgi:MFS family permease
MPDSKVDAPGPTQDASILATLRESPPLVGMIGLVYRPATAALLSELTPKHRQVFALYRMGLNVGTTIAPMFGYLLILGSYNLLFWGEAAAGIIYTVMRKRWAVAVFADRRYTLFLGALLINATVYIQYVSVLPLAIRAAGIATFWYAILLTLNSAIVIGCELLMTKMTQRWPARVVALAGFALLGCGLALYSVPGGLLIFIAGTLVWTLAEITAGPTMSAYPANAGPAALKSKYLSTSQAAFTLGFAIGPAIGVFAWDQVGREVWWLYGAASLVGLVLAWYGMRPAGYSEEVEATLSHGDTAATA